MNFIFFILGTLFFIGTMGKQIFIIIESPIGDRYITSKVLFLIFNLAVVSSTWMLFYEEKTAAIPFFIAAGLISVWTYFFSNKPLKI
jgi:hypothetical protein